MILVTYTSGISNLLTIGHGHLLYELFGEVIIPPVIKAELLRFHSALPDLLKHVARPSRSDCNRCFPQAGSLSSGR